MKLYTIYPLNPIAYANLGRVLHLANVDPGEAKQHRSLGWECCSSTPVDSRRPNGQPDRPWSGTSGTSCSLHSLAR